MRLVLIAAFCAVSVVLMSGCGDCLTCGPAPCGPAPCSTCNQPSAAPVIVTPPVVAPAASGGTVITSMVVTK